MSDLYALPPLSPFIVPLSNADSDRLKARYPGLPASPEHCLTCGGSRQFRWYATDSLSRVVDYQCSCEDQWVLNRVLLAANIQVAYQRLRWLDLIGGIDPGAQEAATSYLDRADAYVRAGIGLILHGSHGTGKTTLTTLVLRSLISRGYDCYFTTFSEMIDTYTGAWNDTAEKTWFHRRIKNAGILVLDDVGREYQGRKASGLPESTFDEVLRHRVSSGKPTIITTNKSLDGLAEGYGSGVMSLLRECSIEYGFRGEDFRETQKNRHLAEIAAGLTRPVVIG